MTGGEVDISRRSAAGANSSSGASSGMSSGATRGGPLARISCIGAAEGTREKNVLGPPSDTSPQHRTMNVTRRLNFIVDGKTHLLAFISRSTLHLIVIIREAVLVLKSQFRRVGWPSQL